MDFFWRLDTTEQGENPTGVQEDTESQAVCVVEKNLYLLLCPVDHVMSKVCFNSMLGSGGATWDSGNESSTKLSLGNIFISVLQNISRKLITIMLAMIP